VQIYENLLCCIRKINTMLKYIAEQDIIRDKEVNCIRIKESIHL
jgi:hypothetical protein